MYQVSYAGSRRGCGEDGQTCKGHHASHRFLGIHDKAFRKTGVDIGIDVKEGKLEVTLTNKMEHPLIIQPARAKFLKIEIMRKNKILWQNYKTDPEEDLQGYFAYSFKKDGKKIIVPATATEGSIHNLGAKETKVLKYDIPPLEKGDAVRVSLYVQLAKSDCARAIDLEDRSLMEPSLIKQEVLKF